MSRFEDESAHGISVSQPVFRKFFVITQIFLGKGIGIA
jgi:hypothetical protein